MRKVYLVIIWTITLACIVFGSMRFTGHFTPFDGHTKKGSQSLEGTLNSIELNGDAFDVTVQKGNEGHFPRPQVGPDDVLCSRCIVSADLFRGLL